VLLAPAQCEHELFHTLPWRSSRTRVLLVVVVLVVALHVQARFVAFQDLKDIVSLASGTFGDVYRADLKICISQSGKKCYAPVACKVYTHMLLLILNIGCIQFNNCVVCARAFTRIENMHITIGKEVLHTRISSAAALLHMRIFHMQVPKTSAGEDEWHELQTLQNLPTHRNVVGLLAMCTGFQMDEQLLKSSAMIMNYWAGKSLASHLASLEGACV